MRYTRMPEFIRIPVSKKPLRPLKRFVKWKGKPLFPTLQKIHRELSFIRKQLEIEIPKQENRLVREDGPLYIKYEKAINEGNAKRARQLAIRLRAINQENNKLDRKKKRLKRRRLVLWAGIRELISEARMA